MNKFWYRNANTSVVLNSPKYNRKQRKQAVRYEEIAYSAASELEETARLEDKKEVE